MSHLVQVKNLTVNFPGSCTPAVDGVSFSIAAGECLAIVGESGSGKTLTARSLIGLTPGVAQVSAVRTLTSSTPTASSASMLSSSSISAAWISSARDSG